MAEILSAIPVTLTDTHCQSGSVQESSKGLTLRANFIWTLAGNVVYAVCQWGMLIVLAKMGTPEMVGQFALGLAFTAPIFLFASLKLRSVQATDARQEFLLGDYLSLRLVCTLAAMFCVAILAASSGYGRETTLVVLVVGIAKALESISDIIYGFQQQHERMHLIAKSMVFKGLLSLLALSVGVRVTGSVLGGAIGLVIAWGLVLIAYDVPCCKYTFNETTCVNRAANGGGRQYCSARPIWNKVALRRLTIIALPLGLVTMLGSLNVNIPRYFLGHHFGEREVGIYSAIASLVLINTIVINALGQSASPKLARHAAAGNWGAFDAITIRLILSGILLGCVGVIIAFLGGREILSLLYGAEYADKANLFVWIVGASGLQCAYVFCGSAINAMRYFKIQLPLQCASTLLMTALCYHFIRMEGYIGAAWAMFGANLFEAIFFVIALTVLRRKAQAQTRIEVYSHD